MRVINRFRLCDFWTEYPRSDIPLRSWFQLVSSQEWDSPEALQATFPFVQVHESLTAFAIDGSTFFLITVFDYHGGRVFVRDLQTHTQFGTEDWKRLAEPPATSEQPDRRTYAELASAFPLRPIQDEDHLRQAAGWIDALVSQPDRTQDEQDFLDVLCLIVEDYEHRTIPFSPVSGADVLRLLINEHRLSMIELIPLLGNKEKVTAVLRKGRPLELRQVSRASRYFKLPPEAFMDPDTLEIDATLGPRRRR